MMTQIAIKVLFCITRLADSVSIVGYSLSPRHMVPLRSLVSRSIRPSSAISYLTQFIFLVENIHRNCIMRSKKLRVFISWKSATSAPN